VADDVDAMLAAVMAEIHAADQREVRAIAAFELAANRRAAAVLDAALTAGGGRPVSGCGCSPSTSRPTRSPAATAPHPGCDHDRTGTVTAPVDPSGWTYV
jgi:hypothetical protein